MLRSYQQLGDRILRIKNDRVSAVVRELGVLLSPSNSQIPSSSMVVLRAESLLEVGILLEEVFKLLNSVRKCSF